MEDYRDILLQKAFDYEGDSTPLSDIIDKEDIKVWRIETEDVIHINEVNRAYIPYGKYCIIAYERYNPSYYAKEGKKENVSPRLGECAIYEQKPDDGSELLIDAMNYASDYRLRYVNQPIDACPNMVEAIIKAKEIIDIWNSEGR